MAITWITKSGLLGSFYEGTEINIPIQYEENNSAVLEIISGELPIGVVFRKTGIGQYSIQGTLANVSIPTISTFTVRATVDGETSDRYFDIITETYDIDWASETLFADTQEYSYLSQYFQLRNPNNNEEFIKIIGTLPDGLTLNKNGLLYGTIGEVPETTEYKFTVGVFVNNELIISKQFIIVVRTLEELNQPIWITQEGLLGRINARETSTFQLNVYEPLSRPLTFEIIDGRLPDGLTLNERTGAITGYLMTEHQATWEFLVQCSNGFNVIERQFSIITNEVSEQDAITWITGSNLGTIQIGQRFEIQLEATSSSEVTFQLISGELPKGLSINRNGYIYGDIDYQDIKQYSFTVNAKTSKTELMKTFTITVAKGLGQNALRSYLYITLEYLNDYNGLKNSFDYSTSYRNFDSNYIPSYKPEVPVADIRCFDKVLLQKILEFNLPFYLTTHLTKVKQVVDTEGNHKYDVFYKDLEESNKSPEEEYISYLSNKHYIKKDPNNPNQWLDEKTGEVVDPTGNVETEEVDGPMRIIVDGNSYKVNYIQAGMWMTVDERKAVFGNPDVLSELVYVYGYYETQHYYLDGYNKIYVEELDTQRYFNIETGVVFENIDTTVVLPEEREKITKYYFRDPTMTYVNVPSLEVIRERLEQKIYVKQLEKDTWYDINTEEFMEVEADEVFEIKWDEELQTYYVDFEDKLMKMIDLVAYDPKTGEIFEDTTLVVNPGDEWYSQAYVVGENEMGKVLVNYKHFTVINKVTHRTYHNVIFSLPHIPYPFLFDSAGQIHYVAKTDIASRNWYYYDKTENIIDSPNLVLPYINDEDILNDGKMYIQFFDEASEILPEWMGGKYFPRMEIFYGKPGQNYNNLIELNMKENSLQFMTERLLAFYCLTFKPKYNTNIDPFDIYFDYYNYDMHPNTLI